MKQSLQVSPLCIQFDPVSNLVEMRLIADRPAVQPFGNHSAFSRAYALTSLRRFAGGVAAHARSTAKSLRCTHAHSTLLNSHTSASARNTSALRVNNEFAMFFSKLAWRWRWQEIEDCLRRSAERTVPNGVMTIGRLIRIGCSSMKSMSSSSLHFGSSSRSSL